MMQSLIAPVEVSVEVPLTPERAFALFTEDFGRWWPTSHHIGADPFVDAVVEPFVGGRWFERDARGAECDWGRVLVWEPPHRLVLSWAITCRFTAEPDPEKASRVEIRFSATDNGTRVEVRHSGFERHGDDGDQMRAGVDGDNGWTLCLAGYRDLAGGGR